MPLGIIAGVGLAGTIASGVIGGMNASTQSGLATSQEGMASTVFGEQQGFEQQLNNLIANPSSVTSLPGYQFQFNQGADAVAREMASQGFLGSGNEATALTQYGQGYAQNVYQQQAQLLMQLSGITSPTNANTAAQGASQANQASFNQWGNVLSSLGYAGLIGGAMGGSVGGTNTGGSGMFFSGGGF
jgi:hypothetical protein